MRALRLLCVVALGACSIKDPNFQVGDPNADAGEDAPTGPVDFVVSESAVTVTESQTKGLSVSLSGPPQGSLLVTVEVSDDTRLGVTPTAVLFSPADWSTPQEITLTGRADPDTSDEEVSLTLRSTAISNPKVIAVTVDDDDGLALAMTPGSLDVSEGGNATISVHLTAMPLEPVTVAIVSSDTQIATVSDSELVFTPANYAIDQEITISGMQDADVAADTAMITFTSPALTTASISVQVSDDDILGISTSKSSLTINEGSTETFTVQLTQQPPADVTVTASSGATAIATASPATLVFTAANWNMAQTVTVTGVADPDVANNSTTITLAATGLATRTVASNVIDDDVQAIVATPASVDVTEGGTAGLGVKLAFKPASDVTIAASSLAPSVATVSPATLTFSPSNYNTNQTLTITGAQDADAVDSTTAIRLDAAAEGLSKDVNVAVDDDDTLGIEVSSATVSATEGGTTSFMVKLTAQPTTNTTVAIASGDTGAATVSPASLSFTPTNWNTTQVVTVTGVQDNDLANESVTLTLSSSGLTSKTVTATITDNDTQSIVASAATATVTEGGTGTVGVKLAFQPAGNVTVNVASGTPAAATVTPATLTFTTANWSTNQNITIAGVEDSDTTNGTSTIALTSSGLTTVNIAATITDNDTLNIDLSPTTLAIGEAGTGTLNVKLTAQPAANTTVTITSGDTGAATVSTGSLTFTTANWATTQTVTVSGVDDTDIADEAVTITAAASGLTSRTSTVTVDDDDTLAIQVNTTTVAVNEGSTTSFQVRLTAQPAANTIVSIASNNASSATASASSLTFTTANYNTYQTVTVTGVEDVNVANETVTFTMTASGATTATVSASVTDNDTQKVLVSTPALTIAEEATGIFTVTLGYQPSANVSVSVSSGSTGIATVNPTTLTFTPSNYNQGQLVTVTGVNDANAVTDMATITASASGATSATVAVTVTDDETLGIAITPTTLIVPEGGTRTVSVKLTAQPTANVAVSVSSSSASKLTVSPTSLTFSSSSWDTYQTVTLRGEQDSGYVNESVSVRFESSGLTTRTASVTLDDDETAPAFCGDGICQSANGETECNCPNDCGILPTFIQPQCICGDGTCSNSELTACSCPQDCSFQCN